MEDVGFEASFADAVGHAGVADDRIDARAAVAVLASRRRAQQPHRAGRPALSGPQHCIFWDGSQQTALSDGEQQASGSRFAGEPIASVVVVAPVVVVVGALGISLSFGGPIFAPQRERRRSWEKDAAFL